MSRIKGAVIGTLAVAALSALPASVQAVEVNWVGTVGDFNDAFFWDPPIIPNINDDAVVNNGGTVQITTDQAVRDLRPGFNDPGVGPVSGTMQQSAGTAVVGGWFRMGTGVNATGTYNQSGGTMETRGTHLFVGASGGRATYNLTGGTVNHSGANTGDKSQLNVGDGAGTVGTFNQQGGTVTTRDWAFVGRGGGNGTYNHTGGSITTGGWLRIAEGNGSVGNYNISGNSQLTTGGPDPDFGDNNLYVGVGGTANGTLTITANANGTPTINAVNEYRIATEGARGTVTQDGGNVTVGTQVFVGDAAGSVGSYTLNSGSMSVGNPSTTEGIHVGTANGTGTFTQNGGSVTSAQGNLIGRGGGNGTYTIRNAGTLAITATGATDAAGATAGGDIDVGNQANSVGVFNVEGSALVTISDDLRVGFGSGGNGTVNQSGGIVRLGTVTNTDVNALTFGDLFLAGSGSTGAYNLSGGVLDGNGGRIVGGGATPVARTFGFTGGRLEDFSTIGSVDVGVPINQQGGTFAVGVGVGQTTLTGNGTTSYTEGSAGTLEIELVSASLFDQLVANNGLVSLAGNLDLIASAGLTEGSQFLILNNDGTDPITGQFIGKPEGSQFTEDGTLFQITYFGNDGNDVVLNVVPEPATFALAALAAGGLLVGRRRRA